MQMLKPLFVVFALAIAASATCPEHFYGGKEPQFTEPKLLSGNDAKQCYEVFSLYHSAKSLTPLWVAERLTRANVLSAKGLPRDNDFHEAQAIPDRFRAWLKDYARSGFDRGHMAPSGNAPNKSAQWETFTLANMVPQAPKLNRGLWERYESALREMAKRRGQIYIITGPLYEGAYIKKVGRVLVPTSVYKVVLDPNNQVAGAIVCVNDDTESCQSSTVAELQKRAKITFFPSGSWREGLQISPRGERKKGWW